MVANKTIDLRSDTVTRPNSAMLKVMHDAEVGDDVWGDDPTVIELQNLAADLLGKEQALFMPSGTQSNLAAIMTHCQRGDEYIVGESAHSYRYEAGGAAVLGSVQPQTVEILPDGSYDLDLVKSVIKPDDVHFARTRLFCLENTITGRVLTPEYQLQAVELARKYGLKTHLDGARLWNAAAALNIDPAELASPFDSISVCLSKGLGAPMGSLLVADEAFLNQARRWRKVLGGGLRQVGIMAAAGIYALNNNRERLSIDHQNAARLAQGLQELGAHVTHATNMVLVDFGVFADRVRSEIQKSNLLIALAGTSCRMVTHLDIDSDDIDQVLSVISMAYR